jgi:oxygen-dependent protoporphyrinogen oxidase
MLAEAVMPPARVAGDETVAEFSRRRFGAEVTERVVDPMVGGLYAGIAGHISAAAAFPKLLEMERRYGSVARGILARHLRGAHMPGSRLFSWRHGIGTLPRALARGLGAAVRTGVTVRAVRPAAGGFRIEAGPHGSLEVPAVVIATQPHVAAGLLAGVDAEAAAAAAAIEAPPLAVAFFGYRRRQVAHPLDGLGFLVPRDEGFKLTGAQFCTTMFPGRAPGDTVAVSGYFGGARAPDLARLPADALIELAREEFSRLLGARGEPLVARVRHWPLGLPQYGRGHRRRIAEIETAGARRPGLFVTGNYFQGPSVAACLDAARDTGLAVHRFLSSGEQNGAEMSAELEGGRRIESH